MLTDLFTALNTALNEGGTLALGASFLWGVFSILLSPCHLSSIPLIISFISTQKRITLARSFTLSMVFALGILTTIALIGAVTASLGRLIGDIGFIGNLAVAGVLILMGLYLMDLIPLRWEGLSLHTQRKGGTAALVLGLLFGLGLGPCTFAYMAPVLGIVFHISQTNACYASALIGAFGIGHIAVIVVAGTFTQWVQRYLNWTDRSRILKHVRRTCGMLVFLGGVYLVYQRVYP